MAFQTFQTDFNFGSYGKLSYNGKDLKYYVSYRPNITSNYMDHIFYKPSNAVQSFRVSNMTTADRVVAGSTIFDVCECIGKGEDIGYSGMFNTVHTYGDDTFLKAGYNPHLILSGSTNTSLIYKTAYSGAKNNYGDDNNILFQITRSNSKLAINRYYGTSVGWREYASISGSSFDQGLIPYVFMFYVQAAGGGGGPSFGVYGGGGGGGGGAVIFMYNFNKGDLYIQLGAPGKGGDYGDSPRGGSGSYSLIYDTSRKFSIYVQPGHGAEPDVTGSKIISKGGSGGDVSFGEFLPPNLHTMTLSAFNSKFKDTCFIMCYGDGGRGGNATTTAVGTKAEGASMTYNDRVTQKIFSQDGGKDPDTINGIGGGGGASITSAGIDVLSGSNRPGMSAADTDRGNGGSGASRKGLAVTSSAGGDGGTSEFQIWY